MKRKGSTKPGGSGFRLRVLLAMMIVVVAITGIGIYFTQRNIADSVERELQRQFEAELASLHSAQEVRYAALADICQELSRKPRIHAALEDDALDLLYPSARDELPDVDEAEGNGQRESATGGLRVRFYRFLNSRGMVISPPSPIEVGKLSPQEENELALSKVPNAQQIGYLSRLNEEGVETIDELVAAPIVSSDTSEVIAAVVLGFKPIAPAPRRGTPEIQSGIWLNGRLQLRSLSNSTRENIGHEVDKAISAGAPPENRFSVEVDGSPHLVFYKLLNPGSLFPPAYEVCIYPLGASIARQKELRWEILGAGALLMLGGLAISFFFSARLSVPVEKLALDSAENRLYRERAEAALELTNEELIARNAELQKALSELEATQQRVIQQERLRALGQMASGIAHDFNNALVPILGFCELLQLNPAILNDKQKSSSYLEIIQTAARDAASVVSRLREFYRSNNEGEEFGPVDLRKLAEQAIHLTQPRWKDQAQANGATIQVVGELQSVPEISGNESALRELLTNLIFNAVDAMPSGGRITLRTRRDRGTAMLEIADTGTGMSEEVRRRCLEPFFSTKGDRGTGLGLSMVFGIVQRHAGELDLKSEEGKGTTFVIAFPLRSLPVNSMPEASKPQVSRSLRVLVVDDEPQVRDLLSAALTNDGHSVELAEHGVDGLRRFMDGAFDMVITDKAMPGMSGDQMATAIKQVAPRMPVILLTGFGQFLDKEKVPNVDVLAAKPIGIITLREAIATALATA